MNMNEDRTNSQTDGDETDLRLPAELVAALQKEEGANKLVVPVEREAQIMAVCRVELEARLAGAQAGAAPNRATGMSPIRESRRSQTEAAPRILPFPRLWKRWAAAAAVVLLAGLVVTRQLRNDPAALEINVAQPTILDAFNLARRLESPRPGGVRHADLNGDGRMDRGDVDWLAQRAVQLPAGGAL